MRTSLHLIAVCCLSLLPPLQRERWQRYHEAVAEQAAGGASSSGQKLTGLQAIAAEMAAKTAKAPVPVPPPNPLIRGGDADAHVVSTLLSIKTPELDEALLVLPFDYVCRLVAYLNRTIAAGLSVEPCVHTLLFLLSAHHKQLIANQTMLDTLRESRSHVRQQLQAMKQRIGFNMAAMKFLERQAKETQGQFHFGEKRTTNDNPSKGDEERAAKKPKA